MNVSKADMGEILAGEIDEAVTGRPEECGAVVAVRVRGGRARCWVRVVDVWPHCDGGYVVQFVRAPAPHTPRLLARTGRAHLGPTEGASGGESGADHGYTSSPFRALGDEPECVPEEWQKDFSEERSQRDQLLRLERVAARKVERWRNKRQRKKAA